MPEQTQPQIAVERRDEENRIYNFVQSLFSEEKKAEDCVNEIRDFCEKNPELVTAFALEYFMQYNTKAAEEVPYFQPSHFKKQQTNGFSRWEKCRLHYLSAFGLEDAPSQVSEIACDPEKLKARDKYFYTLPLLERELERLFAQEEINLAEKAIEDLGMQAVDFLLAGAPYEFLERYIPLLSRKEVRDKITQRLLGELQAIGEVRDVTKIYLANRKRFIIFSILNQLKPAVISFYEPKPLGATADLDPAEVFAGVSELEVAPKDRENLITYWQENFSDLNNFCERNFGFCLQTLPVCEQVWLAGWMKRDKLEAVASWLDSSLGKDPFTLRVWLLADMYGKNGGGLEIVCKDYVLARVCREFSFEDKATDSAKTAFEKGFNYHDRFEEASFPDRIQVCCHYLDQAKHQEPPAGMSAQFTRRLLAIRELGLICSRPQQDFLHRVLVAGLRDQLLPSLGLAALREVVDAGKNRKIILELFHEQQQFVLGLMEQDPDFKVMALEALAKKGVLAISEEIHWRCDRNTQEYSQRAGIDLEKVVARYNRPVVLEFGPGNGQAREERRKQVNSIEYAMADKIYYELRTYIYNLLNFSALETELGASFSESDKYLIADVLYKMTVIKENEEERSDFTYSLRHRNEINKDPRCIIKILKKQFARTKKIRKVPSEHSVTGSDGREHYPEFIEINDHPNVRRALDLLSEKTSYLDEDADPLARLPIASFNGSIIADFDYITAMGRLQVDISLAFRSVVYYLQRKDDCPDMIEDYSNEWSHFVKIVGYILKPGGVWIADDIRYINGVYYALPELNEARKRLKDEGEDIHIGIVLGPGVEHQKDTEQSKVPMAAVMSKGISLEQAIQPGWLLPSCELKPIKEVIADEDYLGSLNGGRKIVGRLNFMMSYAKAS